MSQTPEQGSMSAAEFETLHSEAYEKRLNSGRRHGPCYSGAGSAPLVWHDQVFEREISPAGTVNCAESLRVGSTQNGLDVILVASHSNEGLLSATSGATITLTTLQADSPEGPFTEIGPSICIKAPAEGISAEPDHLFARFPIGNFSRAWLKIRLEFSGSISGGKIDAALSYVAR